MSRALAEARLGALQVTLDALGAMFSKAKDVMKWLTACARATATRGEPVSWHTPLGLPIVQPYRRKARALLHPAAKPLQASISAMCACLLAAGVGSRDLQGKAGHVGGCRELTSMQQCRWDGPASSIDMRGRMWRTW